MVRKLLLIVGLIMIVGGGVVLGTAGVGANVVGAVFAVLGLAISYLQLFVRLPLRSTVADPGAVPSTQPVVARPRAVVATEPKMYQGVLLLVAGFCAAAGHLSSFPTSVSQADFLSIMSFFIFAAICNSFGFPGVYALTAPGGRRVAMLATTLTVTGAAISGFVAIVSYEVVSGGTGIPATIGVLSRVNNGAFAVASLLLAIAVWRAGALANWPGWASLGFAVGSGLVVWRPEYVEGVVLHIGGAAHGLAVMYFGYRIVFVELRHRLPF